MTHLPPNETRKPAPEQDNSVMPWWWKGIILAGLVIFSSSNVVEAVIGPDAVLATLRNVSLGFLCAALAMIGAEMLSSSKKVSLASLIDRFGNHLLTIALCALLASTVLRILTASFRNGALT